MGKKKQLTTFINLLTDFAFKKIFGQEVNKKYLLSLLSAVLKENIVNVEYNDKEMIPNHKDERGQVYDIFCTTDDGRKLIVEMQNAHQEYFDERAIFYISGQLTMQGQKGDTWDFSLVPVYGIFIMNFKWKVGHRRVPLSGDNLYPHEEIGLYNYTTNSPFSDKIKMFFIKLPLAKERPEQCESLLEAWTYILKNLETMDAIPAAFNKYPIFSDLGNTARVAALTDTERRQYERSLKAYRDNYASHLSSYKSGEDAKNDSHIRRMFKKGQSVEFIADMLGETIDTVKSVLNLK